MAEHDEELLHQLQEKNLEWQLLKTRKIFLWSAIDDETAKAVVIRLLSLDAETPGAEIILYINSPGGAIHAGLAIYDAMQAITSPVSTVCTGMAASMGSVLLAGGAADRRFAWPNARVMMHQPLIMGTIVGNATDLNIQAEEIVRARGAINHLYARHTGQDVEKVAQDTDRDFWLSAEEAKDYHIIDEIITTTSPAPNDDASHGKTP
jgi:ATP-dependent Clp protease protease subunit